MCNFFHCQIANIGAGEFDASVIANAKKRYLYNTRKLDASGQYWFIKNHTLSQILNRVSNSNKIGLVNLIKKREIRRKYRVGYKSYPFMSNLDNCHTSLVSQRMVISAPVGLVHHVYQETFSFYPQFFFFLLNPPCALC